MSSNQTLTPNRLEQASNFAGEGHTIPQVIDAREAGMMHLLIVKKIPNFKTNVFDTKVKYVKLQLGDYIKMSANGTLSRGEGEQVVILHDGREASGEVAAAPTDNTGESEEAKKAAQAELDEAKKLAEANANDAAEARKIAEAKSEEAKKTEEELNALREDATKALDDKDKEIAALKKALEEANKTEAKGEAKAPAKDAKKKADDNADKK